jgi:hypothetical protein
MTKVIGTDLALVNSARYLAGDFKVTNKLGRVLGGKTTVSTLTTAANVTYTAAQILGGLILRDPNGGARTDVLPTAALLAAELGGAKAGDSFEFTLRNTADANETITVGAGVGGTVSGTATVAQNNTKRFLVVFTSSSAYTIYSLGTIVH